VDRLPLRGTLLNTLAVLLGSLVGLALQSALQAAWQTAAITGIGLVVACLGIKMFLETRLILVVVAAIAVGGVLGAAVGIDLGLARFAEWAEDVLGGQGSFNEGLLTASLLFCVGPMTLLGCVQDGMEKKIDLLAVKSLLDGIASVFLAATLGVGVLASAGIVLLVQGLLTLLAHPLAPLAKRKSLMTETTAIGGVMLVSIGLNLAGVLDFPTELLLPGLVVGPLIVAIIERRAPGPEAETQVP